MVPTPLPIAAVGLRFGRHALTWIRDRYASGAVCKRRSNIRPRNRAPWPAVAEQNQASAVL
jgi:hypothetical protein